MKIIALAIAVLTQNSLASLPWINPNPEPRRKEFVTDESRLNEFKWSQLRRESTVTFQRGKTGSQYFVVISDGGKNSLTIDLATGKVVINGKWKEAQAANEFWKAITSAAEAQRKHEITEATYKAIDEMLHHK